MNPNSTNNINQPLTTTLVPLIDRKYEEIKSRQVMFTIDKTIPQPNTIFESSFKSFYILEEVKEMLKRNDSSHTILKVISFLEK